MDDETVAVMVVISAGVVGVGSTSLGISSGIPNGKGKGSTGRGGKGVSHDCDGNPGGGGRTRGAARGTASGSGSTAGGGGGGGIYGGGRAWMGLNKLIRWE